MMMLISIMNACGLQSCTCGVQQLQRPDNDGSLYTQCSAEVSICGGSYRPARVTDLRLIAVADLMMIM